MQQGRETLGRKPRYNHIENDKRIPFGDRRYILSCESSKYDVTVDGKDAASGVKKDHSIEYRTEAGKHKIVIYENTAGFRRKVYSKEVELKGRCRIEMSHMLYSGLCVKYIQE